MFKFTNFDLTWRHSLDFESWYRWLVLILGWASLLTWMLSLGSWFVIVSIAAPQIALRPTLRLGHAFSTPPTCASLHDGPGGHESLPWYPVGALSNSHGQSALGHSRHVLVQSHLVSHLVPSVAIYSETFCNIVYENAYTAQNLSETITITFNSDVIYY